MSVRYRLPETVKLELSHGDWLVVKKRLTAGEYQRMLAMYLTEDQRVDGTKVGFSKVASHLLDWSFQGPDGQLVAISGLDPKDILAHLQDLPLEDFQEVRTAIDAHIDKMDKEIEAEKNAQAIASASSPISRSPEPSGGAMSGSMSSIEMSTV